MPRTGGADLVGALFLFPGEVEALVVGHDHLGTFADDGGSPAPRNAAGVEPVDFLEQHLRVEHHAVADAGRRCPDAGCPRAPDEDEFLAAHHQGVAGVVAALIAHHHVGLLGQEIDDLPLALIAPLGAHLLLR